MSRPRFLTEEAAPPAFGLPRCSRASASAPPRHVIRHAKTGAKLYESDAPTMRDAVERAVRAGVMLDGASLCHATLGGAQLSGARLSGADLRDAHLCDASLSCADMSGANLRGANLHGAVLHDTDLRGVDLGGADIRGETRRPFATAACLSEFIGRFGLPGVR